MKNSDDYDAKSDHPCMCGHKGWVHRVGRYRLERCRALRCDCLYYQPIPDEIGLFKILLVAAVPLAAALAFKILVWIQARYFR